MRDGWGEGGSLSRGNQELLASIRNSTRTRQEAGRESRGRSPEGIRDAWGSRCAEGSEGPSWERQPENKAKTKGGVGLTEGAPGANGPGRMSVGSGGVGGPTEAADPQLGGRVIAFLSSRRLQRPRHIPPFPALSLSPSPAPPPVPAAWGKGKREPRSLVPRVVYLAGGWRGSSPSSSRHRLRVQSGLRRPPASSPSPLPLSPAGALWLRGRGFLVPRRRCLPAPSASSLCLSEAQSGGRHLRSGWERPRSTAPASPSPVITGPGQLIPTFPPSAPPLRVHFPALLVPGVPFPRNFWFCRPARPAPPAGTHAQ